MTRQNQIDAWWEHKSKIYPFECTLSATQITKHQLTATKIFAETQLDFINQDRGDHTRYRFLTEQDLLTFQKHYGATTS